jgi:hypothetical protein
VNDHIVASTHQEYSPDLGDGLYPTQESIDHRSLILGLSLMKASASRFSPMARKSMSA